MTITEQEKEFYTLKGRVDSHAEEISGIRGQIGDIHGIVGGLDTKLDRLIVSFGSGVHPATPAQPPQEAIEHKTDSALGKAERILKNPATERILWVAALLTVIVWLISAKTDRPVSDFLNFTNTEAKSRSAIGPLERGGAEAAPSNKPTTREATPQ